LKSVEEHRRIGAQTHEGWEIVKLGDIVERFIGGGTPSTSDQSYWDGRIAWMTSAHITARLVAAGQRYITERGLAESATNIVPKGNLLVSTRVGIGKVAVNLVDIAISQDLTGVLINKDRANTDYVYWCLTSASRKLRSLAQGSTIKGILKENLANLSLPLPRLAEQRRIAEILGTVDGAIEKVDKAIEKAQRLKRGIMRQLLTKGIGHKKSKISEIGKIPAEWEVKPLCDAVGSNETRIVAGPFGSNLKVEDYRDEGVPIVRLQNIDEGRFVVKDMKYISRQKAKELSYHSFVNGDIVLAKLGDPIGKTCIIPDSFEDGIVVADVVRIRVDEGVVDKKYIMYALNSFHVSNQLNRGTIGTTRPRVNLGQVRNLLIPLPSLPEQRRIAEILEANDGLIEVQKVKRDELVRIKKGLMNDLLTGQRRVKV